ncbi:MAG TPA: RdgB/HAM1 family non-canonical purine NTP pyrophosphatase [Actinomycetota bacterium]|nr:RdgB/HAM1 family non-canonical purine NTP pyrophosphatase [Actinomycetota bacterium]
MSFPPRLAIASRNPHKLRELGRICADWPVRWVTVKTHEGEWPNVDEPHETYRENALLKAREVAVALGVPAIADDSGLEVDALGGGPGPRSARFAGETATDAQNLAKLVEEIAGVAPERRTARYRCVAAIAWPDGPELVAEGVCEGAMVPRPRGLGGFGYDPAFVPAGSDRTMAELADEEKDAISHRGRAFRALRALLAAG